MTSSSIRGRERPNRDEPSGFTLIEVIISLALLGLFAALAFGLLQSTHLQLFRGNKHVEVGHVTQTAVEHFKALLRAVDNTPKGGCPGESTVDGRYCYQVMPGYWAVYDYESGHDGIQNLYRVELVVNENAAGAPGAELATFTFLALKEGF